MNPHQEHPATSSYESQDIAIDEPVIFTVGGERVNKLIRGRSYKYTDKAAFAAAVGAVRFGMLIKTISGVELGGAVSAPSIGEAMPHVPAGSIYGAAFYFTCSLNPGVYFLNAGVVGLRDGTETYLHRLIDAAMFHVLPESGSFSTGLVDFNCIPEVAVVHLSEA